MADTSDHITRAGNYVLGLMSDGERERAERDLETDPSFREAVVEVAERMHVFDRVVEPEKAADDTWKKIKERIDGMPQMRHSAPPTPPSALGAPVNFGRRRSDPQQETIVAAARPKAGRTGLHTAPARWAMLMALCLLAAFALGYVTGISSVTMMSGLETPQP